MLQQARFSHNPNHNFAYRSWLSGLSFRGDCLARTFVCTIFFFFFREQFAGSETRDRVTYAARKRRNRHNSDAETIKKKKRERVCRETRVDRVEQMCIIEDRSL